MNLNIEDYVYGNIVYEAQITTKDDCCLNCAFDGNSDSCLTSPQCSLIGENFDNIIWVEKQ